MCKTDCGLTGQIRCSVHAGESSFLSAAPRLSSAKRSTTFSLADLPKQEVLANEITPFVPSAEEWMSEPLTFETKSASLSLPWSPPCITCGSQTSATCSNAMCDKHCPTEGNVLCSAHIPLSSPTSSPRSPRTQGAGSTLMCKDIWDCAQKGDIEALGKCLEDGVDINSLDSFRNSPLFYACSSGQKDMVADLLHQGARDDPLLKRCWWHSSGDKEIRKLLEAHYDEQYEDKQVEEARRLVDMNESEREGVLLAPIARYLARLRDKGLRPPSESDRLKIEQLIPDEVMRDALETRYKKSTQLEGSMGQSCRTPTPFQDKPERLAFVKAASSLDNLRVSLETPQDSHMSELEIEAARLAAWSLEELLEMNSCKICYERMADCVLIPCGHLGYCTKCLETQFLCPTCQTDIGNRLPIFRV